MSDSAPHSPVCPKCGRALPADSAHGLCPRCVTAGSRQPSGTADAWEPPTAAELARWLPDYDIATLIGRGGMGAVYQGTQKSLDRPVAIKILSATLDESDQGFAERFKNEARALGKLTHPGIVSVYDFGTTANGLHYIVMEFIDGTDVARMIARKGRLPADQAMVITARVCDALAYAHERGIIHRDIKPANVMVGHDGVVQVADFGLAKVSTDAHSLGLTQSGVAMGTMHYMAPEALTLGSSVDHRADIYAVGVMLYQMLTGKLPQGMFNMPSLMVKGLDPRYDSIIGKALMEDREERYQSVTEMRRGLNEILTQPVVKAAAADAAQAEDADDAAGQEESDELALEEEELPPAAKRTSPLLWATLIALIILGSWEFARKRHAPAPEAASDPASENVAETPVPEEPVQPAVPPAAATPAPSVAPALPPMADTALATKPSTKAPDTATAMVQKPAVEAAPPKPTITPPAPPSPQRWNLLSAIANPPPPSVQDPTWAHDPLDRFVLKKLEDAGLRPNPDTSRHLLLRRVTFDLTGLPPTPQEIDTFVKDPAPLEAAYARVVKRLLDSPRFGERWARHWLDVVRYADTSGGERPKALPMAWRYRDWVIDSLNADKPYHRFVVEQVAGDLAPKPSPDMQIATGFLSLGANDLSMIGRPEFVMDRVHEQIDTMTRTFLGFTVGCARCHDHRGDPIKQTDYYALAGIFLSTQTCYATGDQDDPMMQRSRLPKGKPPVERDSLAGRPLSNTLSALPGSSVKEVTISRRSVKVGMMEGNGDDVLSIAQRNSAKIKIDLHTCMGAAESAPVSCALRERGELDLLGPMVPRGAVAIPGLPPMPPIRENESGRLQLAAWLISPQNPLTPRVLVNRVWLHLFGRGIVNSPDDFGFMGDEPTHPELLDHLATRFMQNGWSVKKLIQTIVMSRSYRMSSRGDAAKHKIDPANKLVWRMNWKRLEAEALRDAWLQLGQQLTLERPVGTQVGLLGGNATPLLGVSSPFRSIYLPVMRNGRIPEMFEVFDFPDPSQVTGLRESTTSGPQALFLMNSSFMEQVAKEVASPVFRASSSQRPETAYMLALNRPPTSVEADAAQAWIKESTAPPKDAWALFVQALLSSPEFRYVR